MKQKQAIFSNGGCEVQEGSKIVCHSVSMTGLTMREVHKRCPHKTPPPRDVRSFSPCRLIFVLEAIPTVMAGAQRFIHSSKDAADRTYSRMPLSTTTPYNVSNGEEDWTNISCLKQRRRIQNRNAQVRVPRPRLCEVSDSRTEKISEQAKAEACTFGMP